MRDDHDVFVQVLRIQADLVVVSYRFVDSRSRCTIDRPDFQLLRQEYDLIMPKTVVPSLANYHLDESLSSPNSDYSVLRTLSTRAQLCATSRGGGLHQQQESKQVCHLHLFWNFLTNQNEKPSRGCNVDCQTRKPSEPTYCPSFSFSPPHPRSVLWICLSSPDIYKRVSQ